MALWKHSLPSETISSAWDCFMKAPLDVHGRCSRCGSQGLCVEYSADTHSRNFARANRRPTREPLTLMREKMRVGIATDHGGFALKEESITHLLLAKTVLMGSAIKTND